MQPERDSDRRRELWWLWAIIAGLFVLYPLSPGPVLYVGVRLVERGPHAETFRRWFEIIYAPLIWLMQHLEPVRRFYLWYVQLFVELS